MRALALAISGPAQDRDESQALLPLAIHVDQATRDRHEIGNAHDIVADVVIEPGIERRLRANIGVHQHGSVGGRITVVPVRPEIVRQPPFAQHAVPALTIVGRLDQLIGISRRRISSSVRRKSDIGAPTPRAASRPTQAWIPSVTSDCARGRNRRSSSRAGSTSKATRRHRCVDAVRGIAVLPAA